MYTGSRLPSAAEESLQKPVIQPYGLANHAASQKLLLIIDTGRSAEPWYSARSVGWELQEQRALHVGPFICYSNCCSGMRRYLRETVYRRIRDNGRPLMTTLSRPIPVFL